MPIRMSEGQAKLFFGSKPQRGNSALPRAKKKRVDLPENQVEGQILSALRARGWVVTRVHVGTFVPYRIAVELKEGKNPPLIPIRIGEKGSTDYLCERVIPHSILCTIQQFFLEVKAPGKRPRPDQTDWMMKRNAVGFTAVWFDSLESFMIWYKPTFGA